MNTPNKTKMYNAFAPIWPEECCSRRAQKASMLFITEPKIFQCYRKSTIKIEFMHVAFHIVTWTLIWVNNVVGIIIMNEKKCFNYSTHSKEFLFGAYLSIMLLKFSKKLVCLQIQNTEQNESCRNCNDTSISHMNGHHTGSAAKVLEKYIFYFIIIFLK